MSWWEAAGGLTPVHAWDALAYAGGNLTSRVGSNTLSGAGRSAIVGGAYFGVSGNSSPFLLGGNITPANDSVLVFFADYKAANHAGNGVIGFSKDGGVNYFTDHANEAPDYPANYLISTKDNLKPRSLLSASMVWGVPNFVAIVFAGGTTGRAYVNGGWGGSAVPRASFPDVATRIGWGNGEVYQLTSDESLIAAGYWTGAATLSDLQALEAACRAALEIPPLNNRYADNLAPVRRPLHQFWDRPQMGFDTVAKDPMQPVHRSGRGQVLGTLFSKGDPNAPMQRKLRCFDEATGRPLAETTSDAAGNYAFTGLDPTRRVFVVAFDDQDHYRAVVADKLLPQLG